MKACIVLALLFASVAAPPALAVSTTNYSDQWWNAAESGWGASALQQGDTIFFDIFVYGAQSQPTWFTAAAVYQATTAQGHQIFSGDLNATTGPYYGGGSFNPNTVTRTRVGTLTFEADSVDTATLTYTVSGVTVTKSVTRQSWKTENIAGSYYGGLIYNVSGCIPASLNGRFADLAALTISQSGAAITISESVASGGSCTYTGTYTQAGHMGTIQGNYSCTNGGRGAFTAFEIEVNTSGLTGRFVANNQYCPTIQGRLGGLRSTPY